MGRDRTERDAARRMGAAALVVGLALTLLAGVAGADDGGDAPPVTTSAEATTTSAGAPSSTTGAPATSAPPSTEATAATTAPPVTTASGGDPGPVGPVAPLGGGGGPVTIQATFGSDARAVFVPGNFQDTCSAAGFTSAFEYQSGSNPANGNAGNSDVTVVVAAYTGQDPPAAPFGDDSQMINVTVQPGVTIVGIAVKGGDGYNKYSSNVANMVPPKVGGTEAAAKVSAISHYVVCYNKTAVTTSTPPSTGNGTTTTAPPTTTTPTTTTPPTTSGTTTTTIVVSPTGADQTTTTTQGAAAVAPGAASRQLPRTGGTSMPLLAAGVALMIGGAIALRSTGRRPDGIDEA